MNVNEWFDKGCDYDLGVQIYAQVGKNVFLLRKFQKGKTNYTVEKLKHELFKFKTVVEIKPSIRIQNSPQKTERKKEIESPEVQKFKTKPISDYPVALHSVFRKRVDSFYMAASLKKQLNDLNEEDETKALELQFAIWNALQENEKCWILLKHFDDTGRIMEVESKEDYSGLSVKELFKSRQRLYVNASKRRKTLNERIELLANETNEARRLKTQDFIIQKTEELNRIQNNIEQLTNLINE